MPKPMVSVQQHALRRTRLGRPQKMGNDYNRGIACFFPKVSAAAAAEAG
jgi:hypothetical protein